MRKKQMVLAGLVLAIGAFCVLSHVKAGELNPPGVPSGTMRTLNEIYAAAFQPVIVPSDNMQMGDLFLSVTGIPGESTQSFHPEWIDLYGYTLHIENGAGIKGDPWPKFSNLLISKRTDLASLPLMRLACNNQSIPEVILERARPGITSTVFYRLTLINPQVTYIAPMSAETSAMEVVSFGHFTRIRLEYRSISPSGQPGPWQTEEWDIHREGGES